MAQKRSGSSKTLGIAALAAAGAAAAAAGYYFYASENAPKNRRIAAKWAQDLKRDVLSETSKLRRIKREDVLKIIDKAAKAYGASAARIDTSALKQAASELKRHWAELRSEAGGSSAATRSGAKKKSPAKSAKKRAK